MLLKNSIMANVPTVKLQSIPDQEFLAKCLNDEYHDWYLSPCTRNSMKIPLLCCQNIDPKRPLRTGRCTYVVPTHPELQEKAKELLHQRGTFTDEQINEMLNNCYSVKVIDS
jgi:hypothetical protein